MIPQTDLQSFFASIFPEDVPFCVTWGERPGSGQIFRANEEDLSLLHDILGEQTDTNIWFTPCPREEGTQGRSVKNSASGWVAWADIDRGLTSDDWALIDELEATVVYSGGLAEGEPKAQVYVHLAEATEPHVIRALNKGLAERFGQTDTGVHDPSRLLRVPGSFHHKAEPREVVVERVGDVRWHVEDLGYVLDVDPDVPEPESANLRPRRFTEGQAQRRVNSHLDKLREAASGDINHTAYVTAKELRRFVPEFYSFEEAWGLFEDALFATDYDGATWDHNERLREIVDGSAEVSNDWKAVQFDDKYQALLKGEGVEEDELAAMRAKFLTPTQLRKLPPVTWLIKGVLPTHSLARLIGQEQTFKSFVALDIAAAIGEGRNWRDHRTKKGLVIVLAAEGQSGISKRIQAWEKHNGRTMQNVLVIPEAIQTRNHEQWGAMVAVMKEMKPVLVIIDTQARVTVGYDENDNAQMTEAYDAMEAIKSEVGATVLVVHHSGHGDKARGRGASSIQGQVDCELLVERKPKQMSLTLINRKQKDGAQFDDMHFDAKVVELGHDEDGDPINSVVLEKSLTREMVEEANPHLKQPTADEEVLLAIQENPDGITYQQLEELTGRNKSSLSNVTSRLTRAGHIGKIPNSVPARFVPLAGQAAA